jgi:diguanylate cyclase (GGDEF)-like protein
MKDFLTGQLLVHSDTDHPFALISLDLNKFKQVNDTFGHATGDELLAEVSARLKKCVQSGDLVSRQEETSLSFCLIISTEHIQWISFAER